MAAGEVTIIRRHPAECPGYLGHGGCWVCLGTGTLPGAVYDVRCRRCGGTGLCAELPGVVVLPEQNAAAGI